MKLLSDRLKWAMSEKSKRDGADVIPADIARAAKASEAAVNYWLNDNNGIGGAKARLLGAYLNVDPVWLEDGSGTAIEKPNGSLRSVLNDSDAANLMSPQEISDLIRLYAYSNQVGRKMIMNQAQSAANATIRNGNKIATNDS